MRRLSISNVSRAYKAARLASGLRRPYSVRESSSKSGDVFSTLRNLLLLIAIYLYFIGWTYVYYYYSHFGISLHSLDIPVYYFFAYSNSVIGSLPSVVIGVSLILLGFKLRKFLSNPYVAVPIVIILFPILFLVARETGIDRAQQLRGAGAKPVEFVIKDNARKHYPKEFNQANDSGNLRMIYQTKDRYFVFVQPTGGEEKVMPRGYTYDISKDHILLATIKLENVESGDSRWLKSIGW